MRKIAIAYALALLSGFQPTVFASAALTEKTTPNNGQKYFDQAQIFLRKADYKQAEIELRRSISERSNVALTHYYLANTLVHLQRHDEAIEEFKRAYKLDPYGLTSGYCRKALATYAQNSQKPVIEDDSIATDGELDAVTAIQHYNKTSGLEIKKESSRIAAIKHQAEREKQRHQQVAESLVKSANLTGELEAREIRNRAKEEVDSIINGPRSQFPYKQALDAERATAIRKNAEEMEVIVKDRAAKRSQQYTQWSKEKSDLLDETVSNLQNQINTKNLPGTPKLNEVGTDLFVRNYGKGSESGSTQASTRPALAQVGTDGHESQSSPASAVVGDETKSYTNSQTTRVPITSRTVRGQIVPPM